MTSNENPIILIHYRYRSIAGLSLIYQSGIIIMHRVEISILWCRIELRSQLYDVTFFLQFLFNIFAKYIHTSQVNPALLRYPSLWCFSIWSFNWRLFTQVWPCMWPIESFKKDLPQLWQPFSSFFQYCLWRPRFLRSIHDSCYLRYGQTHNTHNFQLLYKIVSVALS